MRCPFCRTENRDERVTCYHCEKDLTMLRLIVNKAKSHFNTALEYAERSRDKEAIEELRNAIELDRSHVNSHIVLGTLYAKTGQMDKAEAAWSDALKIDPRFDKARAYLDKSQTIRDSLPIVGRLRFFVGTLLVLFAGVTALLWWSHTPNPNRARMESAWRNYRNLRYDAALQEVDETLREGRVDLFTEPTALVRELILAEQNLARRAARVYLDLGLLGEAAGQIDAILECHPGGSPYFQAMLAMRDETVRRARQAVDASVVAYGQSRIVREEADEAVALYQSVAIPAPDARFLAQTTTTLASLQCGFEIDRIQAGHEANQIDSRDALRRLAALRQQHPGAKRLPALIDRIEQPLREELREAARQALAKDAFEELGASLAGLTELAATARALRPGAAAKAARLLLEPDVAKSRQKRAAAIEAALGSARFDSADEVVATLEQLAVLFPSDDAGQAVRQYRERLKAGRLDRLVAQVRRAHKANDYEQTVEKGERVLASGETLDDISRAAIQAMVAPAHERLADQRWRWMAARAKRYIDSRLSVEEAETTIRWYPQTEARLSRRAYPTSRDNLLFYLAMAQRRLGQKPQADKNFQVLKEKFPKSDCLRWVKVYEAADARKAAKRAERNQKPDA